MNPAISPATIGWLAVAILLAQILLGLFMGRSSAAVGPVDGALSGKIPRNLHVLMGLALLPLAFLHGWNSMLVKGSAGANQIGMWMGTFALLLMAVQIMLGLGLIRQSEKTQRWSRKIHLTVGIAIAFLTGAHLLLNR